MDHPTLARVLQARAHDDIGLTLIESADSERHVSYGELHRRALRLLGCFQDLGLGAGDEMVLFAADNFVLIEALWACLLGGLAPVILKANARPECRLKLHGVLRTLRSAALLTGRCELERLGVEAPGLPGRDALRRTRILVTEDLPGHGPDGIVHRGRADDVALLQFSSGSTGMPKGIALTHRNVLANLRAIAGRAGISGGDTCLSWMPLSHDMGLVGFHLLPLAAGCAHHILATELFARRPLLWLEKAAEKRATLLGSPNFGFEHCLRALRRAGPRDIDLSAVRLIFNGGEPISAPLCAAFESALAPHGLAPGSMFPCYGLAEATLAVTAPSPGAALEVIHAERAALSVGSAIRSHPQARKGTAAFVAVGSALDGTDFRIVDDEDRPLPDAHVGHVQVRGGGVGRAYGAHPGPSGADWCATGDIGVRIDDLFILGRSKDTIVVNGLNLHPHDIERICAGAHGADPGKVACVGVRRDHAATDCIVAFLQFRGALEDFVPIAKRMTRAVSEAAGVALAEIVPVRTLPMTSSGKIRRFVLRDRFEGGMFDATRRRLRSLRDARPRSTACGESRIERDLTRICNETIGHRTVSPHDNLFDIGADSLALISIHQAIDSSYPRMLQLQDFLHHPTIAALAHYLHERQSLSARAAPPIMRPEPVGGVLQD
jgi:acyl-CoA synthetase (AMP-forming)/AMP-acid ligase II/acyl carrier protein